VCMTFIIVFSRAPIIFQLNLLRTLIPCYFKVHFIVIPSDLKFGKYSSCYRFYDYEYCLSLRCIICQLNALHNQTPCFIKF
jgi:hypothetical protein